jgi:hypothetical protein
MSLPHITNSTAGRELYDPYHNCLFEVYFTLPAAIQAQFGQDEALLTEHVQTVGGLDALDKGPETVQQKFQGTTRTFLAPKMDNTSAEDISVVLSLNLRNSVDNYIYKLFKAWKNLNYDLETGTIVVKKDYVADWLRICIANRAGDVIREIVFKDVMLKGSIEGMGDLDYSNNEAGQITVHFSSDWWKETIA